MKLDLILPSKDTTDRIVPWLTVAFVVCGGGFGLAQYTGQLHSERVQETMKFVREYQSIQKDGSSVRGSLEDLLEKGRKAMVVATDGTKTPTNEREKRERRQRILNEVVRSVRQKNLEPKVNEVLDFLTTIAICARERSCDTRATVAYFGGPMFDFLNDYCGVLEEYGRKWNTTFGDEIFWFIYRNDVHLQRPKAPGQELRFFCERYREIERRSSAPGEWLRSWYGRG